jgi:hypothetical protein
MKLAIVGSRGISILNLDDYITEKPDVVISGGAKGIDTLAENWADKNGIQTEIYPPEYKKYGRAAPLKRNDKIIDAADEILVFWDGKSPGTRYDIERARKQGKPMRLWVEKEAGTGQFEPWP